MERSTRTFDWNLAKAFLATAERGSLSAAARHLRTTQPTIGRQVSALEESLGVVLFDRLGKSLVLTPAGIELLEHVRAMGDAANLVSLSASGQSQSVSGQVCITASEGMSAYRLPQILVRLRELAPEIEIEVLSSNAIHDLRRREADIAIRHVRPEQPDLIARLVSTTQANLCASTEWLSRHGRPRSLAEVSRADFIGFDDPDRMIRYLMPCGLSLARANFKVSTNNSVAGWEMVRHGLGMSIMTRELIDSTDDVEAVLAEEFSIEVPTWLTTHRELHTSRRIRVVFDALAEALGDDQTVRVRF